MITMIVLCSAASSFGNVEIVNDFSGGGNTPNGYPGVAGDGWATKWSVNKNGSGTWSGSVVNQALRVSNNMNVVGTQHIAMTRAYDVTLLDLQAPYTIEFDIAFTTLTHFGSGDYVGVLEGGSNTSGIPTNSQFWGVYFDGSDGLLKWYDASQQQAVSTGLSVSVGTTYSFAITIDPVAKTWIGTVTTSGSGGSTVTSSVLNLGTNSDLNTPTRTFRIYSRAVSDNGSTLSAITYDFDNLVIRQGSGGGGGGPVYYLSPSGAGNMDGSDWNNAFPASQINNVINNIMVPGATLRIGRTSTNEIINLQVNLTTSGTSSAPKRIVGVDRGYGLPVFDRVTWVRTAPEDPDGPQQTINISAGASHWEISNLVLRNVRYAVRAPTTTGAARVGLVFRNIDIDHVNHGFYMSNCTNLRVEDCSVTLYTKQAYRIQSGCEDVTFRGCLADLSLGDPDWWNYSIGLPYGFVVYNGSPANHNITFEDCFAYNNRLNNQPNPGYFNGDGFVVENNPANPNTGITFKGCVAVNNEDAGFDIKSEATFIDCVAVKNYNGFRLWDTDKTLTNCVSAYLFRRTSSNLDGVPSTTGIGIWIKDGNAVLTNVTVHNGTAGGFGLVENGSGSMVCYNTIVSFEGPIGNRSGGGNNISFEASDGNVFYRSNTGINPNYVNPHWDWNGIGNAMNSQTYGSSKGYYSP
jgi:hypothetical protein